MGNTCLKWVLFGVGVYVNTFVFAMVFAFGVFLNSMLDKFRASITMTISVQAIFTGVALSTGILSGILISRFGKWRIALIGAILCPLGFILSFLATSVIHLYISIGVISGAGVSIVFICSAAVVGKTFTGTQRLLALTIQNAGISVGVAILPYLVTYPLEAYGLNGTFLLIGGFYLNLIPGVRLFALVDQTFGNNRTLATKDNTPDATKTTPSTSRDTDVPTQSSTQRTHSFMNCLNILHEELVCLKETFKKVMNLPFILSVIAVGLTVAALNGYFALITDILIWKGFTPNSTLIAFPISYGIGVVARLLPGLVKQIKGVNSFILPVLFNMCGCIGQLIIIYSSTPSVILVGCGLCGLTISGVVSGANILVVKMVEPESIATGIGLVITSIGIMSAISGPSYGAIRDWTNSYDIVLYITSAIQLVGMALFVLTVFIRRRRSKVQSSVLEGIDNIGHSLEHMG